MEKEFVNYEIALSVSELGFNKHCFGRFSIRDKTLIMHPLGSTERTIKAPLHQQLIDWFKSEYNIWVNIDTTLIKFYKDEVLQPPKFQFIIEDLVDRDADYLFHSADEELFYFDYKECREQSILKTIEIIKSNQ